LNQDTIISKEPPFLLAQAVGDALTEKGEGGATALEIHKSFSPELAATHSLDSMVAYLEHRHHRGDVQVVHGSNVWSFTAQGARAYAKLNELLQGMEKK